MPYKDIEKRKLAKKAAYLRRKDEYMAVKKERKQEIRDWFDTIKQGLKCYKCEENHPACIDFHHLNPKDKRKEVAYMAWHGFSKESILLEIAKCVVICSNCHRKLHYEENRQA